MKFSSGLARIYLSAATPTKTDYATPRICGGAPPQGAPYAAVSASQWVLGTVYGVLLDGGSPGGSTLLAQPY
jgi:hypothetical protein